MSLILNQIQKIIKEAVNNLTPFVDDIVIEKTRNIAYGDYATNIAILLAPILKQKPEVIAKKIIAIIKLNDFFTKIDFVFPGFINLTVNQNGLSAVITEILKLKTKFGSGEATNIKYNLEIVSANPTGILHIGHARNGAIGDAVARILKFAGNIVETEYYLNDAGNQINVLANTICSYYLQKLGVNVEILEQSYQGVYQEILATNFVNKYQDKFIAVRIVNGVINDEQVLAIFKQESVAFFLQLIKTQLKDFRINIDYWSSELEMYTTKEIDKLVKELRATNKFFEKDGALWLKTTDYGDDKDRVLVKQDKSCAYILPDLACHNLRIKRAKANYLVNFWGADHHSYLTRMQVGLQILGYDANILKIVIIQMVRLIKDGQEYKMSKRKGTAVWLIDLVMELGIDVVRYMLCSKASSSHMDLDLSLLTSQSNNNPVYYFQYATARCASILRNVPHNIDLTKTIASYNLLTHPKERELIKVLDYFSKVVKSAAKFCQPNIICDYIQELTRGFHSYYSECKILDETNITLSEQRLHLIISTQYVFKNALNLIAVDFKDQM
ncbi:arginine--tRNA ligase [Spiroplasma endosymbiont of 'Nebria riversi']|uniref:arginine--tRNA ligase n=1 Tax=Spiroplasma endosymbiont of 'Nebria riversi' TaxID=2792084 RepID=UPI001C050E2B|nr:arginine--tRNA ligase [Spiroplasma endosymbiont of 'Nebria riversi']